MQRKSLTSDRRALNFKFKPTNLLNALFSSLFLLQYNDVAVLTLDSPVPFTQNIRPICLPEAARRFGATTATVIGWGSLRESK